MTTNGNHDATSWDESRQLGQLFMMGFDGTAVNDQVKVLIEKYHVGTILLTAKNLKSAEQTTQLVLDLQTLAHNAGHQVPLLIAIDQENGGVNSLYDEIYIRQFPSAMGMAASRSKQLAKYIARATAQELASCGINWILGPVMDVLTNTKSQPLGVRSFGDDPQEVSAYATECLKGYQEGGLATCGKHFPSYGNLEFFGAPQDVPTITDTLEHLSQNALVPFRNAIAQGIDAMMVGGVALSSSNMTVMHACLSEQVVQDLLRLGMHFKGVVVSECLEMEALSRNIGISGGTVMAFNAGCDIILTCRSLSVQEEAINGLQAGLDNGMIERSRVAESVRRVLEMKDRYTSWEKAFSPPGVEHLARLQPLHTNFSTTAYNKSITVVRDQRNLLPLSKTINKDQELLLLTPLVKPLPASGAFHHGRKESLSLSLEMNGNGDVNASIMSGEMVFRELGRSLARQRNGRVSHASYTENGLRPIHENLLDRASAVVVVTADAGRNLYQNSFAKHINALCKLATGSDGQARTIPCIVIAVSSPFDFASETSIGTYICTYDFTETALQALVRVLYGELSPTGILPGRIANVPKTSHARQQWLVEKFNEERDSNALDSLLKNTSSDVDDGVNLLQNVTSQTFLLRNSKINEAHFVVRNSTTKELFGFCATYYNKSSQTGRIGAIIVEPSRRRLSIGHSLHDRAIRALLQERGAVQYKLGTRLPNIFPGILLGDNAEHTSIRQWFSKLGWNTMSFRRVFSMTITDLVEWTPPEGLGLALSNPDIKYDLVHGSEYTEAIMEHVRTNADVEVQHLYQLALPNKEGCAIIRAKYVADGSIMGTVLLYRSISKLAPYIPGVHGKQFSIGGLSSPVISKTSLNKNTAVQGLMLLGTRQLKRQGITQVLIDYIDDESMVVDMQALGFSLRHTFEDITSDPITWTMTAPT